MKSVWSAVPHRVWASGLVADQGISGAQGGDGAVGSGVRSTVTHGGVAGRSFRKASACCTRCRAGSEHSTPATPACSKM